MDREPGQAGPWWRFVDDNDAVDDGDEDGDFDADALAAVLRELEPRVDVEDGDEDEDDDDDADAPFAARRGVVRRVVEDAVDEDEDDDDRDERAPVDVADADRPAFAFAATCIARLTADLATVLAT